MQMKYVLLIILISISLFSCSSSSESRTKEEHEAILVINGIANKQHKSELKMYLGNMMKIFKKYGGTPIARYKTTEQFIGEASPELIAIIGFPDKQAIKKVLNGEEFKALSKVRTSVFNKLNIMICEGI